MFVFMKKLNEIINYGGRTLYDNGKIMIGMSPHSGIDHDAFVFSQENNFTYCSLPRGIMEEFALAGSVDRLKESRILQDSQVPYELEEMGLNLSDFAWACAKAYIVKQEERRKLEREESSKAVISAAAGF
jgi:hypothetical protein